MRGTGARVHVGLEPASGGVGAPCGTFLLLVGAGRQDLRTLELGLVGHARNTDDGRVEVVGEGLPSSLEGLDRLLREEPSTTRRPGHVTSVVRQDAPAKGGITGFVEK